MIKLQTRLDWSQAFISLDDIYYFGGQNDHNQIAILNNDHPTNGQIPFKRDDIIGEDLNFYIMC